MLPAIPNNKINIDFRESQKSNNIQQYDEFIISYIKII